MENERVLYVEIESPSGDKRLSDIAIKFRVSKKMGSVNNEAKISIANLSRDDSQYLTTYLSPYIKPSARKRINLYAGYAKTGYGLIFSGDIYKAIPDGLPDTWLNIEAKTNYFNQQNVITYSEQRISVKQLAQNIATQMDCAFSWQATSEKIIDNVSYLGSKAGLIKNYNELTDVIMFQEDKTLIVVNKSAQIGDNEAKLVNYQTGMIGNPLPNDKGIEVKSLLDPNIYCGRWIKTESIKLPSSNGNYQVYELTHTGGNRETDFYTIMQGKIPQVL